MFPKSSNYTDREASNQSLKRLRENVNVPLLRKLSIMGAGGFLVGLLMIVFGILQTSNRFLDTIGALFDTTPSEPEVDISSLIVEKVRGVSELTTAVYSMEAIVPASQDRKVGNFVLGKTQLLYIAHGEVRAGVDLSELDSNDIKVSEDSIQVTLPAPEIIDSKIDVNRSQVYDYNRGFLNLGPDVAPQLQTLAERETLVKIEQAACSKGLLDQANERAETAVTNLLSISGYQAVEVKVTSPQPEACQPSNNISATSGIIN